MPTSFAEKPVSQSQMVLEKGFYPVVVEYGDWWSVYRAGCFNDRHPDINPQNFLLALEPSGAIRGSADIYLGYFDQMVDNNRVLVELDRLGLRPANLPELLALAADYPNLQTQFPIVALMAMGKNDKGDIGMARLGHRIDYRETQRNLDWEPFEKGKLWQSGIRFAAVKK